MGIQAECTRVWLDVSDDSRIEGAIDGTRNDLRFTISCEDEEFDLTFKPEALRHFLTVAEKLLGGRPR